MEIDFIGISAAVGFVLPLVISLLKQDTWPSQIKKYFSFGLALVSAVVSTGLQMGWTTLSFQQVVGALAVIFPLAQTTYTGFWEDTKVEVKLAETFDRSA